MPRPAAGAARGMRDIRDCLSDPDPCQTVRTLAPRGTAWDETALPELADAVLRIAAGLRAAGLRPGETLPILAEDPRSALAAFLGAQAAGVWPALLAPSSQSRDLDRFAETVNRQVQACGATHVFASARQVAELPDGTAAAFVTIEDAAAATAQGMVSEWPGHIQFTSGSGGPAKPIRITPRALRTQIAALGRRLDWTRLHGTSFWLPWYHDMGLVGGMLAPLAIGCDMRLMAPADFVRNPLRFLETLAPGAGALTAMPPFGLEMLLRAMRRRDGRGPDLSGVHGIIIGAEPIPVPLLRDAETTLGQLGLRPGRLLPAYGLAEAVLAVTLPRPGDPLQLAADQDGEQRIACGVPVEGIDLLVADAAGTEVPPATFGEIRLRGIGLAMPAAADGWFRTGDAAFMDGPRLIPVGRFGDAVKVRGTFLFAEEIERSLKVPDLRKGRFVVVLGHVESALHALLVTWGPVPRNIAAALAALRSLTGGATVRHISLTAGSVPRTTSGKVRRREIWKDYRRHLPDGSR